VPVQALPHDALFRKEYITALTPGKWDHWRDEWVIMQVEAHDRLELPTAAPTGHHSCWEKVPNLQPAYLPVMKRIWFLAKNGLTSMIVLFNFLSKHIAPLQHHARSAWMYNGENDATRLERSPRLDLDPSVLTGMLSKRSIDPSSADFINHPAWCMPLCLDQAVRLLLLKELPPLDDIDIAPWQKGNHYHGVHILRMGVTGSRRSVDAALCPSKGTQKTAPSGPTSKVGSWSTPSDIETSSEETAAPQRRRLVHCDGCTIDGLSLPGQ
jgi:hypothetical protein